MIQTGHVLTNNVFLESFFNFSDRLMPPLPMFSNPNPMPMMSLVRIYSSLSMIISILVYISLALLWLSMMCMRIVPMPMSFADVMTKHPTQPSSTSAAMAHIVSMLVVALLQLMLYQISCHRSCSASEHTMMTVTVTIAMAVVAELVSEEVPACAAEEGGAQATFSVRAISAAGSFGTVGTALLMGGCRGGDRCRLLTRANRTEMARVGMAMLTSRRIFAVGRRVIRHRCYSWGRMCKETLSKMGIQAHACRAGGDGDGGAAAMTWTSTTGGCVVLELEVAGLALGWVAVRAVLLVGGVLLGVGGVGGGVVVVVIVGGHCRIGYRLAS